MIKKKLKAQSALESIIVYTAGVMVLGAAMSIFSWGLSHIPIRQLTYEVTRVPAGRPGGRSVTENGAVGGYKALLWPTYRAYPITD